MESSNVSTPASRMSLILESQPSCLEFSKAHDIFVIGTYNLQPEPSLILGAKQDELDKEDESSVQNRTGSLIVCAIAGETVHRIQTKSLPYAVLDLHFSPCDQSILAVATSVGYVDLFRHHVHHGNGFSLLRTIRICDSSVLVLSLAYRGFEITEAPPILAVSLSNGHLATFTEEQAEDRITTIPVHSQEAWTVAWSKIPSQISAGNREIYSGGDDSALCRHSVTSARLAPTGEARISQDPVGRDLRTHGAGVTAIVALPFFDEDHEIIMTGSYDEHVRLLTAPVHGRGRAKLLAEERLGGGVWRLSSPYAYRKTAKSDHVHFKVLASCMHAGARVLEVRKEVNVWSIEIVAAFTEHESMNYASDVQASEEGDTYVSTSFYDRKLCIWRLNDVSEPSRHG